ncbi:hypothetical protein SpCBS45565_g03604 [Spizellomyces sp. 'palustris']|nr:hypothetical protein SpCBS45565_g03604 [Spizellomyces sp. 'palustris']
MSDAGSEAEYQEEGPSIGIYEGERNENKERHGRGKNIFPNGDIYEGTYLNGSRNGFGVYKWKKTRARYSGEYKDNLRDGQGDFVYPDGSKYRGQFKEGKRHGQGTYVYVNGDTYIGEWQNDKKHGKGTYTIIANGSKMEGDWKDGLLKGTGKGQPDLPASITFKSTGYTIPVTDKGLLGQRAVMAGGDE